MFLCNAKIKTFFGESLLTQDRVDVQNHTHITVYESIIEKLHAQKK